MRLLERMELMVMMVEVVVVMLLLLMMMMMMSDVVHGTPKFTCRLQRRGRLYARHDTKDRC